MARRKDFSELTRVQIPAALHLMRMGYTYLSRNSKEIEERDPDTNILVSVFKEQFLTFNNYLTDEDFERELANIKLELDQNDLGRSFFKRIQGQEGAVYIDWENPEANIFHLALEVTCQNGQDEFRPDIVVFINGLPLSYIEVKQPNAIRDGKTGIQSEQDRTRYRFENRKFRRFNNITQLIALSDNLPYISGQGQQKQGSYYGSNAYSKTKFNAFKEEREEDFLHSLATLTEDQIDFVLDDMNHFALKSQPEFKTNLNPDTPCNAFLSSLYQKERLLFMLRFGLVYVEEESKDGQMQLQKHVMRYPQYFATRAIEETIARGVKKGVIWHTQGSGKTALAFFNIRYLTNYFSKQGIVPQFYFVVDRLDLADQAFKEFTKRGLKVKRINSPQELNQKQDGYDVAVVNIQKFKDNSDLTDRSGYDLNRQNIYFIDEAHRSYNERGSYLPNLYQADTNAIKIALTGTPLITYKKDGKTKENHATTRDIFGDYIHKYYYNQSIDDGFTLRLMREDIETSYKDNLRSINEEIQRGGLSKEDIFAHPRYVEPMLDFIIEDFNRARDVIFDDQTIGGMIVCDSSKQARELEKQLEKRRKAGTINLTSALILHDEGDKEEKKDKVDAYKEGKIDLIIVYSMLLTGFDAPRLKRLYLGRKIKAHNLLQTLTRVNRPYKDYLFGYVIDFADISKEFDSTNRAYLEELNQEYDTALTGENGEDVLVVYDDLTKHAAAYRTLSLLLKRAPGREAYPGDVFYLHSRLLERASRLSEELGGGSLTALPIIETQAGDVSAYIPTNVISITDGQIYLETEMFNSGFRPAINAGLSVSRVGGSAQIKAMKKIAGPIRVELAQYRELASFAQFGSELDAATKEQLAQGARIREILKQPNYKPMPVEYQIIIIFAATQKLLLDIEIEKISEFQDELFAFIDRKYPEIPEEIRQKKVISDELAEKLKKAIAECKKA